MKNQVEEITKGILSIRLIPENDIERNILKKDGNATDEVIEVYFQDAVYKYNSDYELLKITDAEHWPNQALVKCEIIKNYSR